MPPRRQYRPHVPEKGKHVVRPPKAQSESIAAPVLEAEAPVTTAHCLLCVFPLEDVTAVPCAHDGLICATCTVKITRHLAAPRCCPFCKTEWPDVVFDSAKLFKSFGEYQTDKGLYPIESLAARSPLKELADKYTKLMTCHCVKCDEIGISIDFLTLEKLQQHMKRKHQLQFCMPCAQHRKAFVGDLQLFTDEELQKHMKEGVPKSDTHPGLEAHPLCQFCRVAYFSRDELYVHMEREHYHCHICYKHPDANKRYERSYKDLEIHFRKHHFLCDDATCLTARFVVFETELGLRGHRLQVHGSNLTQKERRAMGNVQVDLVYRTPGPQSADFGHSRPPPSVSIPLNDLDQFPLASSSAPAMTGMGWVGPRFSSQAPLTSDNFPDLHPSSSQGASSNGIAHDRLPLRPSKPIIEPCTDRRLMQERNSALVASMKSLAGDSASYKQFKQVSQEYLNGQGTKASDFLACFMAVFGGLDGTTQDIIEGLISLLPDEQKRQALHLVYRHEVDRLRLNPPSSAVHPAARAAIPSAVVAAPQWVRVGSRPVSARPARPHVVNAPATPSTSAVAAPVRPSSATSARPQSTAPSSSQLTPPSNSVFPSNPIAFGRRPPPVVNEELFPTLGSLSAAIPAQSGSSDYCWKTLDDALELMDPRQIQVPDIVTRRLDLCLAFGRHSLSILKSKFEPNQGIPVSGQALRRVQNQARCVTISDLDVEFPLKNLGVHVGCITRLQVVFRNAADLAYGPIQDRVDRILKDMTPNDLYTLVEYIVCLFRNIEAQRPKSVTKVEASNSEQHDVNEKQSKKNRQRSKKRTLIQFG